MEKTISLMYFINEIEKDHKYKNMYNDLRKSNNNLYYYDKYFPYDDIKILRDKLGHLTTK